MPAHVEVTRWPFTFVVDQQGHGTQWVAIHAPIQSPSRVSLFADYRMRGIRFVGVCSFMTFPQPTLGEDPLDYEAVCEGWGHCFREPQQIFTGDQPRVLLSLSDFTSAELADPRRLRGGTDDLPPFDFVFVAADEPWKLQAKNWDLATRCISRMCTELGLHGLVLGAPPGSFAGLAGITTMPRLPYGRFLQVLSRTRFLFLPSELDASPRVLAEALCLDVPVLVNRAILGGWKYVTAETGEFFDAEDDVVEGAARCLSGSFEPRAWWRASYGPLASGERLRHLIEAIDPSSRLDGPLQLSYRVTWASDRG